MFSFASTHCMSAFGALIIVVLTLSGPDRINSYGRPTICSLELMDTMAFQQNIQNTGSKVVTGAIFQNNVNVRVFDSTEKFPLRHATPPHSKSISSFSTFLLCKSRQISCFQQLAEIIKLFTHKRNSLKRTSRSSRLPRPPSRPAKCTGRCESRSISGSIDICPDNRFLSNRHHITCPCRRSFP